MLQAIKNFFSMPKPTSRYSEVRPGAGILDGIVKVEEPLRSPVRGQNCVAYFYRSFLVSQGGRQPMPSFQKLKEAEVYTHFTLEMDGGSIDIIPTKRSKFTRELHQELAKRYGSNFQSTEDVILPGARVRLSGTLKKSADGKSFFKMTSISVIDKQVVASGVVGDRKKRRKNKK